MAVAIWKQNRKHDAYVHATCMGDVCVCVKCIRMVPGVVEHTRYTGVPE